MMPLRASKLLIVEGVEDDPLMGARVERLRAGFPTDDVRTVDDAELNRLVEEGLAGRGRHGMRTDIEPIVVLNRFRFDDAEGERTRRIEAFPSLKRHRLNGYGGFDWRDSGSGQWRQRTGLVCQPAWQMHLIVGCHFRCAYCSLGWLVNVMTNVEEYISRLDGWLERCPSQTLFQYDNYTDAVCFEPEYDAARQFVEYFSDKPGKALELYVGKSDHVDFLLDYEHRGHTVCCWSLAGATQASEFEWRSAPTEARIESMRQCQEAGYAVRVRLSPIIPVRDWREENRAMLESLFSQVDPDMVTIETIRFMDWPAVQRDFDLDLLDEGFVAAMRDDPRPERGQGCELHEDYRRQVYAFIFDEIDRLSPKTQLAFCREQQTMWDSFRAMFQRHGQDPARYMCNCGPHCAPASAGM